MLKRDRVSSLQCHRQLLEQVDGLPCVTCDGGRSPADLLYQLHRLMIIIIINMQLLKNTPKCSKLLLPPVYIHANFMQYSIVAYLQQNKSILSTFCGQCHSYCGINVCTVDCTTNAMVYCQILTKVQSLNHVHNMKGSSCQSIRNMKFARAGDNFSPVFYARFYCNPS